MRHTLVTGANRGLGLELVRQLLARGDQVIACCRDTRHPGELAELADAHTGQINLQQLDMQDSGAFAALATALQESDVQLDLLFNNAGVLPRGERFGTVEAADMRSAFEVNTLGPMLLTQALASQLAESAQVIMLASQIGSIGGCESFSTPSYAISKAALHMATRQLGHALASRGISVTAISPGWVRTDMGGPDASASAEHAVSRLLELVERLPLPNAPAGALLTRDGTPIPW